MHVLNIGEERCFTSPDVVTFSAALTATAHGQKSRWTQVLDDMVRMTSKFTLQPDIIVYAAVCNAFEKAERWRQTSRLLSSLHHQSCEPDRALWNSARGRQWRDTLHMLREQLVTSTQVADAVAATAVLQAATTGTRWSLALVLARPAVADLPFYQAKVEAMKGQKDFCALAGVPEGGDKEGSGAGAEGARAAFASPASAWPHTHVPNWLELSNANVALPKKFRDARTFRRKNLCAADDLWRRKGE
eukprot:s319_g10.t1